MYILTIQLNRIKLFLLLFLLISTNFFAQQKIEGNFNFRNYTVNNGLPSSETYDIEQDNEGNIWIATDRGVVKYNGRTFKVFKKKDGLVDDVVIQIYKDYKGRLWFLTMKIELCYYENGKIKKYKYNHIITKNLAVDANSDRSIVVKKDNTVILTSRNNGIIIINQNGRFNKIYQTTTLSNICIIGINKIENQLLWSSTYICNNISKQKNTRKVFIQENLHGKKTVIKTKINLKGFRIITTGTPKCGFLLCDNLIYNINTGNITYPHLNHNIISIQKIENKLFIGTYLNGVQVYNIVNGIPIYYKTILNNFSISTVYQDKNGGLWFSTLESGIFYLPFESIRNFTKKNGLISNDVYHVFGLNKRIYLGLLNGCYQIISNNKNEKIINTLPGFTKFGALGKKILFSFPLKGTYLKEKSLIKDQTIDFYSTTNSTLLIGEPVIRIFENGRIEDLTQCSINERKYFRAIMEDNTGQIWAGDLNGIYKFKNRKLLPYKPNEFSFRVTDLLYSSIWGRIITTRDGGVFFLNSGKFTKLKGLLSDDVSCVFEDSKKNLWFATKRGVNVVKRNKLGELNIECITQNHGLISNEINSLFVDEKYAWVGTKKGLSKIDISNFHCNKQENKINLTSIILDNKTSLDLKKDIVIPYNKDIVKINFNTINFVTKGKYKYRFHSNSSWSMLKDPELTLFNPEDGIYNLEVAFLNENNQWSTNQKIVSFEIEAPFWRKTYFKILLILIIGFFIYLFIRFKKGQFETKQKLIILEQKALFAQMNPHFIFNTLNSIQSFLIYNENDKAEYFLSKFSKLLRETLHISRNSSVLLSKEIDILKKYLELEQMRFSNKFQWEIIYKTSESDLNFRIPNMLIQPYIENSIKHGFTEKRSDFKIDIVFTLIDNFTLKCEVIDNGIGREASQLNKKDNVQLKDHISYGEKITKERLKSYTKKGHTNYGSSYIDLEILGESKGTKVEIIIPIIEK